MPTNDSSIYDSSLTAAHISNNLKNYEAARSGFFSFIVSKRQSDDALVKATFSGETGNATAADKYAEEVWRDNLRLNVVKTKVPHFSLGVEKYQRGNEIVKFAGVPEWPEGELVVDDVVGLDTKGILEAWKNEAYNVNTRKGGRMVNYKRDCQLIEYTQDYVKIRSWTLYGCWISALDEGEFDRENDSKRQITATIQYDRAVMAVEQETETVAHGGTAS